MSKPGQFLITLSGGRSDILQHCPGERIKFRSLGWVILITSGVAVVSMWFALTSASGVHAYVAFPLALLWGLVIMGIDRWLVVSLPYDRGRKWLIAAPRLALALLLGSLISTPIVLRVFQPEINNQISVIKQENAANFVASQQRSTIQQQVTKWQATVTNLNMVIDSGGQAAINPSTDPTVQGLTKQLTTAQTQANKDYAEWKCELYGGHCGAPKGNGQLTLAIQRRYEADLAQVSSLQTQIKNREAALQANDQASQQKRLQQAQQQLPEAKAQLTLAQNRETQLANEFDATNESANGLLIRLQALDQLTAKDGSLALVRWLLFLLFLVIEILPVAVKLLTPPGQYDEILRKANQQELRRATWQLRSGEAPPVRPTTSVFRWLTRAWDRQSGTMGTTRTASLVTCPQPTCLGSSSGRLTPRFRLSAVLSLVGVRHSAHSMTWTPPTPTCSTRSCGTSPMPGPAPPSASRSAVSTRLVTSTMTRAPASSAAITRMTCEPTAMSTVVRAGVSPKQPGSDWSESSAPPVREASRRPRMNGWNDRCTQGTGPDEPRGIHPQRAPLARAARGPRAGQGTAPCHCAQSRPVRRGRPSVDRHGAHHRPVTGRRHIRRTARRAVHRQDQPPSAARADRDARSRHRAP